MKYTKPKMVGETQVRTGKVRFSYLNVFEPRAIDVNQTLKYSARILIPADDTATLKLIKHAIDVAVERGREKFKWSDKTIKGDKFSWPLKAGEAKADEDPSCEGMMYLNSKAQVGYPPKIIDADMQDITDQTAIYSGAWGQAQVSFFPFSSAANLGISCGLDGLQMREDGEPLGGKGNVRAGFVDDDDDDDDDFLN